MNFAAVMTWPKPTSTHGSPMNSSWPCSVRMSVYGGTEGSVGSMLSDEATA